MSVISWDEFERQMLTQASVTATSRKVKYHDTTPARLHRQLAAMDKALTKALQVLLSLDLKHRPGQDLETDPFNWPVVQELATGRWIHELSVRKVSSSEYQEVDAYPTQFLTDLEQLRDVARRCAEQCKPRRGQSTERSADSRDAARLARNFVFSFRANYGEMPPMSSSGPVVDLLQKLLDVAGLCRYDAARLLQTAIERDKVGRDLVSIGHKRPVQRRRR